VALSQKKLPNAKIGKNETEITLFSLWDNKRGLISDGRDALGAQGVYRVPWKKYTKIGIGVLITADYNNNYNLGSDVFFYGALFADLTQFIGKRQIWSVGGQAGHGIYKREYKYEEPNLRYSNKYTGGMHYSISVGYRIIVSKNILIIASPFIDFRNFPQRNVTEYYSPPSVQRIKSTEKHSGFGFKFGVVF